MNKHLFPLIVLGMGFIGRPAVAGVEILSPALTKLPLYLKVGTMENLVNNPARLANIKYYLWDNFFNAQTQDSEPKDAVFSKKTQNEGLTYSGQVIAPLFDLAAVNVGYSYDHLLLGSQSISNLDQSVFRDENRNFDRDVNLGLALQPMAGLAAGYAWSQSENINAINLSSDDVYLNHSLLSRHVAGVTYGAWDVFLAYAADAYQGEFNHNREAEFASDQRQANVRFIWGEVDKENVCTTASYTYASLSQNRFERSREGYALDFLNNQATVTSYYYLPLETLSYAAGLELAYADKTNFVYQDYAWKDYQTYQASLPCMLSVKALSWLQLWAELDVTYTQNTLKSTRALVVDESLGLRAAYAILEINLYALPSGTWIVSGTEDNISAWTVGLQAEARF